MKEALTSAIGYGATTLPALTEAITIEKDAALANHEAGRLTELINKLADRITPTRAAD